MVEKPNPSNSNNIEMNVTAHGDSKVTQVGQLNAEQVQIIVADIRPFLERSQQISQVESPGVLKAGNPQKSLAYWQGRKTEIAQIQEWLTDKNTFLIGIEGIGGTGKSMLMGKSIQVDLYGQLIAAWEKTGERESWNYSAAVNNLGVAYKSLGQYRQAIEFHQQLLDIAREIGDRNWQGGALGNLGVAYLRYCTILNWHHCPPRTEVRG